MRTSIFAKRLVCLTATTVLLLINACKSSTAPTAVVASVVVTPGTGSLRVGQTLQLSAAAKDAGGATLDGRTISWGTSSAREATVSDAGLVTAVGTGTVSITATAEGEGGTAFITVMATPIATTTVSPDSSTIYPTQTVQLAATLKDSAGNVLAGRTVTWTSSDTTIANVSTSGLVTGRALGTATITATSNTRSGTATVTVASVPVSNVVVTPDTGHVAVGATLQLTATLTDSAADTLTGRPVTWTSSDTTVARASASGQVTGIGPGTVTITATSGTKTGTATITVFGLVASVTITPDTGTVKVGHTLQLVATTKDSTGVAITGRKVTWMSSDTTKAKVSGTGLVSGRAAGIITITATSETKNGTASITVAP
jgi:uncharacterized protein YjdB